MGRRNKEYHKDLHQQAYDRLNGMMAIGDSKKADMAYDREHDTDILSGKIYSYATYKTYMKHTKYFLNWLKSTHPKCKTLKKARKYVPEWLQSRVDYRDEKGNGLSAWTIQTEAAALNKLYGIKVDDPDRFQPPKRKREDIKRSRGTKARDALFNEASNEELIHFCQASGCRRNVLERLIGDDLYSRSRVKSALEKARSAGDQKMIHACEDALTYFPDQDYFLLHRKDKGGKTRIAPIIGPNKDRIVQRMKDTAPDEKVWQYVNSGCDVHGYRSDYATYLYKQYARPIEDLDFHRKIKCSDGK